MKDTASNGQNPVWRQVLDELQQKSPKSFFSGRREPSTNAINLLNAIGKELKDISPERQEAVYKRLFSTIGVKGFGGFKITPEQINQALGRETTLHEADSANPDAAWKEVEDLDKAVRRFSEAVERFSEAQAVGKTVTPKTAAPAPAPEQAKVGFWKGLLNKIKNTINIRENAELDRMIDASIKEAGKTFVRSYAYENQTRAADARGTYGKVSITSELRDALREDLRGRPERERAAASQNHTNIIRVMLSSAASHNNGYQTDPATKKESEVFPPITLNFGFEQLGIQNNEEAKRRLSTNIPGLKTDDKGIEVKIAPSVVKMNNGITVGIKNFCNYNGNPLDFNTALKDHAIAQDEVKAATIALEAQLKKDYEDRISSAAGQNAELEVIREEAPRAKDGSIDLPVTGHTEQGTNDRYNRYDNAVKNAAKMASDLIQNSQAGSPPFPPTETTSKNLKQHKAQGK